MRIAPEISLTEKDREQLTRWARGFSTPYRLMIRSKIVLRAAEGAENAEIAEELELARGTVGKWRSRFASNGIAGIEKDAPRPGRKPRISTETVAEIIRLTTQSKPEAETHWSLATMAAASGVSPASVARIWNQHGLKPHLAKSFKVSTDPKFAEKLEDVIGLYLNPPEHAIVLSVDEKSQIQALDRTQPGLPLKKGRCGTMTHDYKRNGTTTLFAALNLLDGKVIGACMPRHRHQEWLKFLRLLDEETPAGKEIHLIADNYATHKHEKVQKWMKRHPRFHMHFTPTSASWLNLVERFFRDLTVKRIRRGVFYDVYDLVDAIHGYIEKHNTDPKPFVWRKTAGDVLDKVARARETLNKITSV